jgi:hypothetical protein
VRPELGLLLAALLAGCPGNVHGTGGGGGGGGTGATGGGAGGGVEMQDGGPPPFAISGKGTVRFKRNVRLTTDFAIALGLDYTTFCQELGQYSCTLVVHPLALGGTDPYGSGLYEPLPFTGATSPIVIDRVALVGCTQRVTADLALPASALIYNGIAVGSDGKMDPTQPAVATAMQTLYRRALLRDPTGAEVEHLRQLYRDIEATGKPEPAKSWMTLSCFAVMSSVESIFY